MRLKRYSSLEYLILRRIHCDPLFFTMPTTQASSTPKDTDGRHSPANSSSGGSSHLLVEHSDDHSTKAVIKMKKNHKRALLDRLLQGYTSFMGSALHQDRGLKLLQYTLWMLQWVGQKSGRDNVLVRDALKKLFNELSFARYVLRFLGLPPALEAARSGSWSASSESNRGVHSLLGKILAWSMIGYYPLEYGAYVQWQTPRLFFSRDKTGPSSRLPEKLSAWSCRFWLAYTVTEIVQCWLKLREETKKLQAVEEAKKNVDAPKTEETVVASPSDIRNLKLQITRDVLFTLPAIHWSLPNWDIDPLLSEPLCNAFMWLESVVCMYQSVANFRGEPQ